jgi:hypothetical protein
MEAAAILLYVGPDQVMPVMSILATIMGFLLVFWNKVKSIFRKLFGIFRHPQPNQATEDAAKRSESTKHT